MTEDIFENIKCDFKSQEHEIRRLQEFLLNS